jgi:hypothetical protein
VEGHAHVLPDAALARFPEGNAPRYVTAEPRLLARMLDTRAVPGVTHGPVASA